MIYDSGRQGCAYDKYYQSFRNCLYVTLAICLPSNKENAIISSSALEDFSNISLANPYFP